MECFVKFASIFEPFLGTKLDKSVLLSKFDKLEGLKRSFCLTNHTINERNVKQGAKLRILSRSPKIAISLLPNKKYAEGSEYK